MAKTFRPYVPEQDLPLPPSLRDWLPDDDLAYFVSDLLDQVDLTAITAPYEAEERGFPPLPPRAVSTAAIGRRGDPGRFPYLAPTLNGRTRNSRRALHQAMPCPLGRAPVLAHTRRDRSLKIGLGAECFNLKVESWMQQPTTSPNMYQSAIPDKP